MTQPGGWQLLGIAPTGDRAAIRRAYAGRLKTLDSAADPEGFRRLRAAYEDALRGVPVGDGGGEGSAAGMARWEAATVTPPEPLVPRMAPVPARVAAPLAGRDRAQPSPGSAEVVRGLIRAGLLHEAAEAWARSTDLALTDIQAISDELAAWAMDADVDARMVERLIETMGWRDAATERRGAPALVAVMQRQLAERWYSGLVATAAMEAGWPGRWRSRVVAARLLLRPAPSGLERLLPWTVVASGLGYWLPGLRRHWKWLGMRVDGERVAWCERAFKWSESVVSRSLMRLVRLMVVLNLVMLGAGVVGGLMLAFE